MELKSRNGTIDVLKFLVMVFCIMGGHFCVAYPIESPWPFYSNGIFVEFYLIITGFYTYHHFYKIQNGGQGYLLYVFKKFSRFLPYIIISNFILYLSIGDYSLSNLWNMVVEDFLLTSVFLENINRNFPLWMLTAMFVVFPVFCQLCSIKNRGIVEVISVIVPLCYYSDISTAVTATYPFQLIRVFSGMLIGVLIYELCNQKIAEKINVRHRFCFGFLISIILLTASGFGFDNRRVILILISISLLFLLDLNGLAAKISNRYTDYLGDLSMIIYIVHAPIGFIVRDVSLNYNSIFICLLLYYVGTIFCAVLLFCLVKRWCDIKYVIFKRIIVRD